MDDRQTQDKCVVSISHLQNVERQVVKTCDKLTDRRLAVKK